MSFKLEEYKDFILKQVQTKVFYKKIDDLYLI